MRCCGRQEVAICQFVASWWTSVACQLPSNAMSDPAQGLVSTGSSGAAMHCTGPQGMAICWCASALESCCVALCCLLNVLLWALCCMHVLQGIACMALTETPLMVCNSVHI
jgi:hypothetical protein